MHNHGNRHEQMQLPQAIKDVLQKPQDEHNWDHLERVRSAVIASVEGACDVHLRESAVVQEVASSIVNNHQDGHTGVVGTDVRDPYNRDVVLVPAGARVAARLPASSSRRLLLAKHHIPTSSRPAVSTQPRCSDRKGLERSMLLR